LTHISPPSPASPWSPVDLAPVLDGLRDGTLGRPIPTVGRRDDGVGLFYPTRVNGLWGASGDGKSWLALFVAMQEIGNSHDVIWLDWETDEVGICERLLELGADPASIRSFLHYIKPEEPYTPLARKKMEALVTGLHPTLVVVDTTGEAMAEDRINPNTDDEVARWVQRMPRPLASLGPAVLLLDHVTKERRSGDLFAIGSQRKRAAISGSAFMVEMRHEFGHGRRGLARLTVAKDRCGVHVRTTAAGDFVLDATGSRYEVSLEAPKATLPEPFRPTKLMERLSRHIEDHPGLSQNAVKLAVGGSRKHQDVALELLEKEGFVTVELGPRRTHLLVSSKPFRQADDEGM
jgi:hypothetical protein